MADNPQIPFTSRDFSSIESELSSFVQETAPQFWSDFFQSNLGTVLVKMFAMIGDMLSMGNDSTGAELFLATCRRYESALRFARSVGYTPRSAVAAVVTVKSLALPAPLTLYGGIVPKGSKIKGQNGLSYALLADVAILAGDTVSRLLLTEGQSFTEQFPTTNQPNQEVQVSNFIVADLSWVLFVGDPTNPANEWTQVDNVQFENGATKTYSAYFDGLGRIHFVFGDGIAGKIPDGLITVNYRTTNGAAGNSPVSSIQGSIQVNLTSPGVGVVSVSYENKDIDTTLNGGTQLQTNENQGTTAAASIQTGQLLNTPVSSGSVLLTFNTSGGTLVLQDQADGTFAVVSNTTGLSLTSSSLNYTGGTWSIHLSGAMAAGGTISATYFSIKASSQNATAFIGAASGGADRESLNDLRRNVPAYIRSQDKIITIQDYTDVLRRLNGIALVFPDRFVSSYTANVIKLNIWSSEDVTFQSESSDGSFSKTPYTRYVEVQQDRVNDVQAYLAPRTLFNVHNLIQRPSMLWVDFYLGSVIYDASVDKTATHQAITDAVVGVFEASTGFAIRLAEVYDAIREVKGVKYFQLLRAALGTQNTSNELVGQTSASTTFAGSLLFPIATPGKVVITLEQTSTTQITIADDGSGAFTLVAVPGSLTIVSSSINYRTGAFSVTFSASLIANQSVIASYANVTADYRANQIVVLNGSTNSDPWPPPGVPTTNPITTPPYKDGLPIAATRAGSPVSPPYAAGDVLQYTPMQDILVESSSANAHFYDETYLYNDEIYYDSVESPTSTIRAINLRRLVFDLVSG